MRLPSSENLRWYALGVGLAAALVLLAALQYRSNKQVSEATTGQMLAGLQGSLMDFRQGLERELAPLCRELQASAGLPRQGALQEYVADFDRWRSAAAHAALVSEVYVWREADSPRSQLLRLNSERSQFEKVEWPAEFKPLRERLQTMRSEFGGPAGPEEPDRPPVAPTGMPPGPPPPRDHVPPPPSSPPFAWMIDQNISALVHPVRKTDRKSGSGGREPGTLTWIVVRLDQEVLGRYIFPEIAQRYFGRPDQSTYEIAVIAESPHNALIYSSDGRFGSEGVAAADAALNLFGRPVPVLGKKGSQSQRWSSPPGLSPQRMRVTPDDSVGPSPETHEAGPLKIEPIHYTPGERDWKVIAKNRRGSVEAAVTTLYYRSLAINFGVLLVLATTIGMVIAISQRSRRLAQLQMDFVASVSHELRTPLTGIVAAAQNIADGVVDSKERVARYGAAILSQAEQLTDLVEQILLFSATQKDSHRYHFQLTDVAEVIDASLKSTSSLIRSSGFTAEQEVPADLPQVMVDFKALSQCLQNLIANAVKYGGKSRWIGIRAASADGLDRRPEVRITVADRGIGIEPEDLKRIFQPFYRTPEATAAQIHGSGLGLALAKTMVEAMGGRLTVESVPRKGSTFTVHLPVKDDPKADDYPSVAPETKSIS